MDFRRTTVADLARQVTDRSLSARETVAAALDNIEQLDGELGAFVAVDGEAALAEARAVDDRVAAGEDVGPLAGVPLAVKDLEDAAGYVTTRGSAAFADGPPAADDSALVERLRAAGCVVVGKTNTPELGWKPDTVNATFGATRNPWALDRSAGGSSGGSAAAVAAGLVPLATGSDGGGSIRIPCSATGLTGSQAVARPRAERWCLAARLARPVHPRPDRPAASATWRCVLDAVVGPEPTDLASLPLPESSWSRSLVELHPPRRVAWSPTLGYAKPDAEVLAVCEAAVGRLEAAGTEVVVVDDVFPADPVDEWLTLVGVYCLRVARAVPRRPRGVGAGRPGAGRARRLRRGGCVRRAVRPGARRLPPDERPAGRPVPRRPACCSRPRWPGSSRRSTAQGTIDGEPDANWVRYTYPFNMTRSPAGTVCAGFTADGMPVGLQVVGPQHADVAVLRALALLEDLVALDLIAPFGAS